MKKSVNQQKEKISCSWLEGQGEEERHSTVLCEHTNKGSVPVIAGFSLSPHFYWKQVVHKGKVQARV